MKLKMAIMGAGNISYRVAQGIVSSENVELTLIASRDLSKAKALADKFLIENYSDNYQDLYGDNVDAIYITTINSVHYQHIKDALQNKKHVICEKPMLIDKDELVELYQLAQNNGCFLLEAMKCRYLPSTDKIKSLLREFPIPKNVSASFCRDEKIEKGHWIYDSKYGGAMVDVGSYVYSMVLEVFPNAFTCLNKQQVIRDGIDETTWIYAKNQLNTTFQMGASKMFTLDNRLEISGEDYQLVARNFWKEYNIEVYKYGKLVEVFKEDYKSEFSFQVDFLAKTIIENKIYEENDKQLKFLERIMEIYYC